MISPKISFEYGTPSILINNAGVTDDALFLRMRESQWDNVIDTNLKGTFRITKAFIRHMIKARKGKIIFELGRGCLR